MYSTLRSRWISSSLSIFFKPPVSPILRKECLRSTWRMRGTVPGNCDSIIGRSKLEPLNVTIMLTDPRTAFRFDHVRSRPRTRECMRVPSKMPTTVMGDLREMPVVSMSRKATDLRNSDRHRHWSLARIRVAKYDESCSANFLRALSSSSSITVFLGSDMPFARGSLRKSSHVSIPDLQIEASRCCPMPSSNTKLFFSILRWDLSIPYIREPKDVGK